MAEELFFTYGPTNVSSLLASTWSDAHREVVDNIYKSDPIMAYYFKNNRIKYGDGASLVMPIEYAADTNSKWQGYTDIVNTVIQDPFTAAQYKWKLLTTTCTIPEYLEIMNGTKSQVFDVVEGFKNNAMKGIKDKFSSSLFTAAPDTTVAPDSFATIIDSTGTIGEIAYNATYWASTETTSGSFAGQGIKDMTTMHNTISDSGTDAPDLILSSQTINESYENTARTYGRYDLLGDKAMVDLGIKALSFKGSTMLYNANVTAETIYFVNTKYIKFGVLAGREFVMGEFVKPANQPVKVSIISLYGNLACGSRRRQGKLVSVTA